jgi:hypothetical protein
MTPVRLRKDGRGLVAVGHVDQGGFGGIGHKGHGNEDATADGDGDGEGFLPGPPDHRDKGGQERDEGQPAHGRGSQWLTRGTDACARLSPGHDPTMETLADRGAVARPG